VTAADRLGDDPALLARFSLRHIRVSFFWEGVAIANSRPERSTPPLRDSLPPTEDATADSVADAADSNGGPERIAKTFPNVTTLPAARADMCALTYGYWCRLARRSALRP